MDQKLETIAETLARYTREISYRRLPSEVIHEVKRRLIDTFACALGAWRSRPAKIAREMGRRIRQEGGATLFGTDWKTTPELAAFANGTAIRYLDYNDTYLSKEPAHPSDNISAALAAAEVAACDGRALIEAILVGYEIQCRLCDAAALRPRGWDHVTYGPLTTALVAAKLWRFSPSKIVHALGLAGVSNIALRQTRVGALSMWKGAAFANAARNGLFAAELARLGMTGPAPIFEGEKGFMRLVSGPFELLSLDKKGPFKIMETYIKYYPVEYHAQSAVQAALNLREKWRDLRPEEIESVMVQTHEVAYEIIGRDPEKWHPETRETADHSLPFCVAVALLDGRVGLPQFNARHLSDPRLGYLIQKVRVHSDKTLSALYPKAIANIVTLSACGKTERQRIDYPRGHPENRMTDAEVEEKFHCLANRLFSKKRIRGILDRLWHLEKIQSIGELMALFQIRGTV